MEIEHEYPFLIELNAKQSHYHQLPEKDEHQLVEILQRFSGVLFQQWEFKQADVLAERANQIIGRAGGAPSYALLGDLMNIAAHERELGNYTEAKKLYRTGLTWLEAQREMRIFDRLPILAAMFLMIPAQNQLQKASLIADMEVSLNQFFCERDVPVLKGIMRVGWMYNFLGYNSAANDLMLVAQQLSSAQNLLQNSDSISKISENAGVRFVTDRSMNESMNNDSMNESVNESMNTSTNVSMNESTSRNISSLPGITAATNTTNLVKS